MAERSAFRRPEFACATACAPAESLPAHMLIIISALLYFLSQHSLLSFPIITLFGLAVGAGMARWRRNPAWYALGIVGFVAGMINIFTGSMVNGAFLNAFGTYGSAVVTHAKETSSQLNNQNIWAYDAVIRTADGRDVKTRFDTMSASLYPPRNTITIPPVGERFVVKYIPGFERNIAIMRDESPFGQRYILQQDRGPVERARAQLSASPDNAEFRQEYRDALQGFLARHEKSGPADLISRYREDLRRLENTGADRR